MTAHETLWLQFGPMGDIESVSNDPIDDHAEYARVTPDTITLPCAEVGALVKALLKTIDDYHFYKLDEETRFGNRKALATLQERMK